LCTTRWALGAEECAPDCGTGRGSWYCITGVHVCAWCRVGRGRWSSWVNKSGRTPAASLGRDCTWTPPASLSICCPNQNQTDQNPSVDSSSVTAHATFTLPGLQARFAAHYTKPSCATPSWFTIKTHSSEPVRRQQLHNRARHVGLCQLEARVAHLGCEHGVELPAQALDEHAD
jgi:hypothetical protein